MENTPQEEIIGICGLWHLGSVLAACWSNNGFKTICFDYDQERVKNLQVGLSPLYEPGLDDLLARGLSNNRLSFTSKMQDISRCDYIFIAWDTAVRDDDSTDASLLYTAVEQLGEVIKETALVIISSQVPIGTSEKFQQILQLKKPDVQVVYSPENLKLGEALKSYQEPGRVILGVSNDVAQRRALSLFKVIPADYIIMDLASAEMVKHGINSF
ncbi:MAG: hypothetical protein Q7R79_04955, partial [bacterium]|nr:hypothetical protein [bacterium]